MACVKVLLVDDEQKLANAYKGFFELSGFAVSVATTGEEAVQLVERERPHVVLLDWHLKGSTLQGLDVLQKTKGLFPNTLVFMYSGYGEAEKAEALRCGADRFLEKPLQLPALVQLIKEATAGLSNDTTQPFL